MPDKNLPGEENDNKNTEFALAKQIYGANIQKQREYSAYLHNTVIQTNRYRLTQNAGGSLSASEQKVLLYIISKIQPNDEELKPQRFSLKEYCDVCGLGVDVYSGTHIKRVKESLQKLAGRVMWLKLDDKGAETIVRWVADVSVYPETHEVEVQLDKRLTPYLIGLKENYTAIPLKDVLRFRCKYSFTLYEYLKTFAFQRRPIQLSIEDLKEILDCTSYNNITLLRSKVLDPSCSDINSFSELRVGYELVKQGRAYTDIIFTVQNLRVSTAAEDREEMQRRQLLVDAELSPEGTISPTLLRAFNIPVPGEENGSEN
ncbi:MAG TPA: replication initiation protein [Methanocorpusculum sp.]|nr:replication initiation protein [Methanocorpusculum sp.]